MKAPAKIAPESLVLPPPFFSPLRPTNTSTRCTRQKAGELGVPTRKYLNRIFCIVNQEYYWQRGVKRDLSISLVTEHHCGIRLHFAGFHENHQIGIQSITEHQILSFQTLFAI